MSDELSLPAEGPLSRRALGGALLALSVVAGSPIWFPPLLERVRDLRFAGGPAGKLEPASRDALDAAVARLRSAVPRTGAVEVYVATPSAAPLAEALAFRLAPRRVSRIGGRPAALDRSGNVLLVSDGPPWIADVAPPDRADLPASPGARETVIPFACSAPGTGVDRYATRLLLRNVGRGPAEVRLELRTRGASFPPKSLRLEPGATVESPDVVRDFWAEGPIGSLRVTAPESVEVSAWLENGGRESKPRTPLRAFRAGATPSLTLEAREVPGGKLWVANLGATESRIRIRANGCSSDVPLLPGEVRVVPVPDGCTGTITIRGDGATVPFLSRKLGDGGTEIRWPEGA